MTHKLSADVRLPDGTVSTIATLLDLGRATVEKWERFGKRDATLYVAVLPSGDYWRISQYAYKSRLAQTQEMTARHPPPTPKPAAWPCPQCHGTGNHEYTDDPSAAGVSLGPGAMTFVEACGCLTTDHCPNCGAQTLTEADGNGNNFHCVVCGWAYNPNKTNTT